MPVVTASDGVAVAAYDFGGDGPDLLLAHATGFHAHVWLPLVEHLRDHFRCVAFDERAHGDSGLPPGGDFAWTGFAADTLAVVDGLALDHPYGVGHSSGGTALVLAEEQRPGTFRAIYCFEAVIVPVDDSPPPSVENPLAAAALRRREVFGSRDEAFDNYASKPPFASLERAALRAYVDHGFDDLPDGTVRLKCHPENEAAVYANGMSHPAFRHLGGVRPPVVFAFGTESTSFPSPFYEPHAERAPHGRVEPLPGLGHFGPLEDPARVAASIVQALTPER